MADALHARIRDEQGKFLAGLSRFGVKGAITEVGWPNETANAKFPADSPLWNALGDDWYNQVPADVWTTAWATGEQWHRTYNLAVYEQVVEPGPVAQARAQAAIVEAHGGPGRGINVAGGEWTHATFDSAATFTYLASRGHKLIRLPVKWEDLQPDLNSGFEPGALGRLQDAAGRVVAAGMTAILDLHNGGAYNSHVVGNPDGVVTREHFAQFWALMAVAFRDKPGIAAYGLMNEPNDDTVDRAVFAKTWEDASAWAVTKIRASWGGNDPATTILIPGIRWSMVQEFWANHPQPWIQDANVRYEAHHYFDPNHSGTYGESYDNVLTQARQWGYIDDPPVDPCAALRAENAQWRAWAATMPKVAG